MSEKLPAPAAPRTPAPWVEPALPSRGYAYSPEPREPSIVSQLWDMLLRRRWTILIGAVVVIAAAAWVTAKMPRVFTSNVTILVGNAQRATGSTPLDVLSRLGAPSALGTELQLLESRRITEPVVDEEDLHVRTPVPTKGTPAKTVLPTLEASREAEPGTYELRRLDDDEGRWSFRRTWPEEADYGVFSTGQRLEAAGLAFEIPESTPANPLILNVTYFPATVTGVMGRVGAALVGTEAALIRLDCSAASAAEAQLVCQRISDRYVALRNELQRGQAVHASTFLEEQSETVRTQLVEAEEELRQYQEQNQVVAPEAQANQQVAEYAMLQARREQMEADRRALAGALERARRTGDGTEAYRQLAAYPTFIGNPMVGNILSNLVQYDAQLHELLKRRTDQNEDVIELRKRIADLEGQLGGMAQNYETAVTGQIAALDRTLGNAAGRLSSVPEKQMELARLERKTTLLSELYTTLQQRLREAEIAKAVELADVSVIDAASLPLGPSSPNVKMNMALAVLAGLLFGLGAGLVREFADTRLRRRDDVERETGLPVLTTIPSVPSGSLLIGRDPRLLRRPDGGGARRPLVDYYPAGGELVVEAFRALDADLRFLGANTLEDGARTVVFTSSWRGEGKTFSAVNFAATRALQGYRTLLIDADLRAGSAGVRLGLDGGPGLAEVLSGEVPLLDAIRMVKVGDHRLAVLTAGTPQGDFTKLFDAARVDELLAAAAENYEQVVLDTPPLNLVSDAALLAARADAVVLVVRSGKTDREALDVTLGRLARLGANTVGVVLNDVKGSSASTPYGVYGGYGAPAGAGANGGANGG
jgi:capsular exopolysaccharide synthesis family protein